MMDNDQLFEFEQEQNQSAYIKVIGVGGGGTNAVNYMYSQGIKGVDFCVVNSDSVHLQSSPVPTKVIIGPGHGAGNDPEKARKYAVEAQEKLVEAISPHTKMLFIAAGMGGGTGTGASPIIAELAKKIETGDPEFEHMLVVAVVTTPFSFEGPKRRKQAQEYIDKLRQVVDSILVINNDKLMSFGKMKVTEAFAQANEVLFTATRSIAEIITDNGYVGIDFSDVYTVMEKSGTALLGIGEGTGENRAMDAIKKAITSPLLNDNDICGAKNVLLYITSSENNPASMEDITYISQEISRATQNENSEADVIWGMGTDPSLNDELKITLVATGFKVKEANPQNPEGGRTIPLPNCTPNNQSQGPNNNPPQEPYYPQEPRTPQGPQNPQGPYPSQNPQYPSQGPQSTPQQYPEPQGKVFTLPDMDYPSDHTNQKPVQDKVTTTDDGMILKSNPVQETPAQEIPAVVDIVQQPEVIPATPEQPVTVKKETIVVLNQEEPKPQAPDSSDPTAELMRRRDRLRALNQKLHGNEQDAIDVENTPTGELSTLKRIGQAVFAKTTVAASGLRNDSTDIFSNLPD